MRPRPDSPGAGYSGTPLPRRLGVRPRLGTAALDAPAGSDGVEKVGGRDGHVDLVVCFVTEREVPSDRLVVREELR